MEDFLRADQKEDTPESLAWKLLMDQSIEDFSASILPMPTDCSQNTVYENLLDRFHILITIYMEMLFGLLKIEHVAHCIDKMGRIDETVDLEQTFRPNLSQFTVDDILVALRDKFKKIRIFLSIREIHDTTTDHRNYGSESEYYCRILLKDLPEGATYFRANKNRLDPDKRYTFVIRKDDLPEQKKLDDFYAVCTLPNMKIRISFSPININQ